MARNSKHRFKRKSQSCKTTKSSVSGDNQQPLISQSALSIPSATPAKGTKWGAGNHNTFIRLHWVQLNTHSPVHPPSDTPSATFLMDPVLMQMHVCGRSDRSHGVLPGGRAQSLALQLHPWKSNGWPVLYRTTIESSGAEEAPWWTMKWKWHVVSSPDIGLRVRPPPQQLK